MIMSQNNTLKPEDYLEPECVVCDKPVGTRQPRQHIPQQRISQKLDELMAQSRFQEAENLLKYWIEEARSYGDNHGEFMVYNEMMGYYRKRGMKEEAYQAAEKALSFLEPLGYVDSVSGATCYTNAATVYTAFGEADRSLELFQKAREIYEKNTEHNEYKLAGLYNNMALGLVATGKFNEAHELYDKAIATLQKTDQGDLEIAITYLNILDALIAERGTGADNDDIAEVYLTAARQYLDSQRVERDSYYAFVADKCLSIYEYFGWFRYARELKERIREIDERN